MAFCPSCGAQAEGRFCAKCGAALPAEAGSAPPPPPPPFTPVSATAPGLAENMASALCYALMVLTGVLFLVLEPYNRNRNIRFHAFQAIFAWIAAIVLWIGASIIVVALLPIPFIGAMFGAILHGGLALGFFIVWLVLMYKAYNNERWVLPVVGPLAEKQA
jgi:uncharacterized membrane protein